MAGFARLRIGYTVKSRVKKSRMKMGMKIENLAVLFLMLRKASQDVRRTTVEGVTWMSVVARKVDSGAVTVVKVVRSVAKTTCNCSCLQASLTAPDHSLLPTHYISTIIISKRTPPLNHTTYLI